MNPNVISSNMFYFSGGGGDHRVFTHFLNRSHAVSGTFSPAQTIGSVLGGGAMWGGPGGADCLCRAGQRFAAELVAAAES